MARKKLSFLRKGSDSGMTANTVIGEGITIQGGIIKGINSVLVKGLVFGDIDVDGEVAVDESGYVKGVINANTAVVSGIVEGDVKLSSNITITKTGNLQGNINCAGISIEDGAVFIGSCSMIVKNNAHNSINKRMKKHSDALQQQTEAESGTEPPRS